MKTIAITSNTSWYLYNFRKNTITELINQGYHVLAIAPQDEYSVHLSGLGCEYIHIRIDQGGTNPIHDAKTLFSFCYIYMVKKPSIVLNFTPKNNIYSTLAAWLTGGAVVNNIAGLGILFIDENFTSKIVRFLYKISQRRANKIFFQNEDDRNLFVKNNLAPALLCDRLPGSGVDLNRFLPSPTNDDGVVRFLLLSRMLFDKGIGYYVKAARYLKGKYGDNVEFWLLGFLGVNNPSAVSKNQITTWVDEGIVKYFGTSDNVEEVIAKIDCIVLPSFYREGVPKSLLEAGAMAKPIITTNNVGCRETVDDGVNGFLCEPHSTRSLIEKLEIMIQYNHEERLKMGRRSRQKMKKEFDERIVIKKYIDAINELIYLKK